jgi:hypothetical protein
VEPENANEKVVDGPVRPNCGLEPETATTVVSEAHELLEPLSSTTAYGEAPPDHVTVAVTAAVCPVSMAKGERARTGVERVGKTETVAAAVVDELSGELALSVTVAQ